MIIVEISENGRVLKHFRGFLLVEDQGVEIGRVPWEDITAILLTAPDVLITKYTLMVAAEHNIPVIVMGRDYHPVGLFNAYSDHGESKQGLDLQIEASIPFQKKAWQQIIERKIWGQGHVLEGQPSSADHAEYLKGLSKIVKSGDSTNLEAIAAAYYWKNLFQTPFKRYRFGGGFNSILNYAYAVTRATVARAVVASGLHPSLGIGHYNKRNPFCLVDDLIEPFRPLIDSFLLSEVDNLSEELEPKNKKILSQIPSLTILNHDYENSTVTQASFELTQSYAQSLKEKKLSLRFPNFPGGLC